jgi:hypothetical protein
MFQSYVAASGLILQVASVLFWMFYVFHTHVAKACFQMFHLFLVLRCTHVVNVLCYSSTMTTPVEIAPGHHPLRTTTTDPRRPYRRKVTIGWGSTWITKCSPCTANTGPKPGSSWLVATVPPSRPHRAVRALITESGPLNSPK